MELRRQQALVVSPLAAVLVALAVAAPFAAAATGPTSSTSAGGAAVGAAPVAPPGERAASLTEEQALAQALRTPKVRGWVARYRGQKLTKQATYDADRKTWKVKVWAPEPAGQIVEATVDDSTAGVTEAWTGPQVAWKMARGYEGAFGRKINDPFVWSGFCLLFLLGLADLRRPLSVRNLDLLVLLSFSVSLFFFNRGETFTAMPLVYPPLLYLLARLAWIGARGRQRRRASRPVWPVWVLLAGVVFLTGFRIGLNTTASNVIDVGYASVIGAQRIVSQGEMPYGHMPTDDGKECGEPDADGYVRERIQTNGRCESANERGDTYGPVTYLAYVPGFLLFGWTGKWDSLPAAHFTSILWDLVAMAGLALVGRRFGGTRLAVTLAFAWAAYPFTQYVSSSNSNDAVMPALLVWGFWLVSSPPARGSLLALASWAKFASLLLVPLWASYPQSFRGALPRRLALYAAGLALGTALAFWIFLLEPDPLGAAHTFWERTFGWQLSRPSPFSIWDWGEYPGFPDLARLQGALKLALLGTALALAFVPRSKSPLQLAALSGALLVGFELVLTHWFYLYIPWFFPFVCVALLAPVHRARPVVEEGPPPDRPVRELVAAG